MPSRVRMSSRFAANLGLIADELERAAYEGMQEAMEQAEEDARGAYRWRSPGEYQEPGADGRPWVWEVTGQTAASITGYAVSAGRNGKRLKNLSVRTDVLRWKGNYSFPKSNTLNPGLTGDYTAPSGRVLGILTMYTSYAGALQGKEKKGAIWGIPGAGEYVTVETLLVNWASAYVPAIIRPRIEQALLKLAARLK